MHLLEQIAPVFSCTAIAASPGAPLGSPAAGKGCPEWVFGVKWGRFNSAAAFPGALR